MIIFREAKNKFILSTSDHEAPVREVGKKEVERILKRYKCSTKAIRKIMKQVRPGNFI